MIRYAVPMFVVLSLLAVRAQAADNPSYAATAEGTQSGDKITVAVKLTYKEQADVAAVGQKEVTTTLSHPKIMLLEGQRAQIALGNVPKAAGDTRLQAKTDEMESGYKFDVISVKGRGEILVVTTVIEHGQVVWADTTTVHLVKAAETAALRNDTLLALAVWGPEGIRATHSSKSSFSSESDVSPSSPLTNRVLRNISWVEVELSAVEEDGGFEAFDVAEACGTGLDGVDLAVKPFAAGRGDGVPAVTDDLFEFSFQHARQADHGREPGPVDPSLPMSKEGSGGGHVGLIPQSPEVLLEAQALAVLRSSVFSDAKRS